MPDATSRPPLVVGFGENSIDVIYRLPHYPQPGSAMSKVRVLGQTVRPGGQVATTLATCARLGLGARYIGAFGTDDRGAAIRAALQQRGVDVRMAVERNAPNRHALILLDESQRERVVLWQRDRALTMTVDEVSARWLEGAAHLHVDATDGSTALALVHLAHRARLSSTCDIDQVTSETTALLEAVTIPVVAEHVPQALTGEADLERALRAMRQRHGGLLVVTLGERGAAMLEGDRYVHVPGVAVTVADTTGAGDVFRGAFIYAFLRGDTPEAMLRFANAAAAVSCTREGAMDGVPDLAAVQRLIP